MSNPQKRAGTAYERKVVKYAQDRGLPWDRAPLRGVRDQLDFQGCQPMGFLVGTKGIRRGVSMHDRLADAMEQAGRAKANYLAEENTPGYRADIVAVQILQKQTPDVGRHYAVMEVDDLLSLVLRLSQLEQDAAKKTGEK